NVTDLSILATNWGRTTATHAQGDANSDGTINIYDLSILASQWGQTISANGSTINSISKIIYDMNGPYEGCLHGVPSYYSWVTYPDSSGAYPPSGMTAMTVWGLIYADCTTTEPSNVRIEMRNMESYYWSIGQQKWIRMQAQAQPGGAHYFEDFTGNTSISADLRSESDGGISTTMVTGYNFHFYPSNRGSLPANPGDVGGIFTTYQARLILDNPAGPNNLSSAKYLAESGADWWANLTIGFGSGDNNPGIGQGRFTYLTTNYTAINFWTGGDWVIENDHGGTGLWTNAQITQNPPPLDAMGN
ncbi:MAG TPA: hypothetical protein VMR51_01150, partial [Patescibacteria group bacterium]|nr:hypothetical protein [Patescibacteria group bacterium]